MRSVRLQKLKILIFDSSLSLSFSLPHWQHLPTSIPSKFHFLILPHLIEQENKTCYGQGGETIACCVFRPANACLRMRSHGLKQLKTFKNHEKSPFSS